MSNKQVLRVFVEIIIGIVVSVIISTIAITLGYTNFHGNELKEYAVNILGVNIFNIAKNGNEAVGTPVGQNMFLMGMLCSIVLVVVLELLFYFRSKKKK